MNLETQYLGFRLPHPLILGACPLCDTVDGVRRAEDAGASAIVLRSLFEEQIAAESMAAFRSTDFHANTFGEALSYFPTPEEYKLGPEEYLEHVVKVKNAVGVPVIASLNGTTLGRWLEYARLIEQAGADALELNILYVATNPEENSADVEQRLLEVVTAVRNSVSFPLAVKLSPYFTAPAHFATRLDHAGANGIVLFNRSYEPDIDVEQLEYQSHLQLSDSSELLLRLRWLAIVSGRVNASLAITGGVHSGLDAIKAVMSGASAVQLVSVVLRNGLPRLRQMFAEMRHWMEEHEYESLQQMCGSMNFLRCPDPAALVRGNYIHMLQTWEK